MAKELKELFSMGKRTAQPTVSPPGLSKSREEMMAHSRKVAAADAARARTQVARPAGGPEDERMMSDEEKRRALTGFAKTAISTFYKSGVGAVQLENLLKQLSKSHPESLGGRKAAILRAILSAGPRMTELPVGLVGGIDLKKLVYGPMSEAIIGESSDFHDRMDKLHSLDKDDDRIKLIYEWIKTGHLSLSEFRSIVRTHWIKSEGVISITEKAKSKAQQRFMGMVHACKTKGDCSSEQVKKVADSISAKEAKKFAKTKTKGLPEKVKESHNKKKSMQTHPYLISPGQIKNRAELEKIMGDFESLLKKFSNKPVKPKKVKEASFPGMPDIIGPMAKYLEKLDKKKAGNTSPSLNVDKRVQKKKKVKEASQTFKGFLTEAYDTEFAPGTKVKKTMGIRQKGVVVKPFYWKDSTDGTYKEPGKDYIPIEWEDGTKGYAFAGYLKMI